MASNPITNEKVERKKFKDGIKRYDDQIKKKPNDSKLLIGKLQLLCTAQEDSNPLLNQLLTIRPPLQDFERICTIEEAVVDSLRDVFPVPVSAGPLVAKIWDQAIDSSKDVGYKIDLLTTRFSRAITDNRMADAQQSLIRLKSFLPKNRSVYMAHVAVTQSLSSSKEDLQSRLALSLARKAVKEDFDQDNSLDCRVPGQIFAIQSSMKDLESIAGRAFEESKQVRDALRKVETDETSGSIAGEIEPPPAIPIREWFRSEVAALKQHCSKLTQSEVSLEVVKAFVANCTRLFHMGCVSLGLAEHRNTAEACFLSISGIVMIFNEINDVAYLLQGAYLAESLLRHNPNVHEARLILVYLYMRLELGSLAIRKFESLRVKEIQFDTVGHTLFTNLSVTHPHSTKLPSLDLFEPYERSLKALAVYGRHEDKLADAESGVLENGQTGMIFDIHQLRDHLRSSLTRRLIFLDHRRTARLTDQPIVERATAINPRATGNWTDVKDNRDFDAAFDYGYKVEKALYGRHLQIPGQNLILNNLVADSAWSIANHHAPLVKDIKTLIQAVSTLSGLSDVEELASNGLTPSGSTAAEWLAGDICLCTLRMVDNVAENIPPTDETIESVIRAIERLSIDQLMETNAVLTEHLTDHYIYIDALRITLDACRHVNERTKTAPSKLQELQSVAKRSIKQLQDHAREQMTPVTGFTVSRALTKDEALWEHMKAFGEADEQEFCADVAASAKEGWGGVCKITLG